MSRFHKFLNEQRFGEYLFGTYRNLPEEDTERESEIFNSLKKFVKSEFGRDLEQDFLNTVKDLKQVKDEYPEILKPNVNKIWRLSTTSVEELVNLNIKEMVENNNIFEMDGRPLIDMGETTYKANSTVQSWTSDIGSMLTHINWPPSLIYEWDISSTDNLLFNSNFLNQLSMDLHNKSEYEVIRISNEPIKVKAQAYLNIPIIENLVEFYEDRSENTDKMFNKLMKI